MTTETPTVLADSDARAEWLEQRRQGITATEVAKAATGRPGDRRAIITEKVTNETRDFDNKWMAWGRAREPFIADWIARNYGIEANTNLMAAASNPRYLATPDGYTRQWDGTTNVAEVKTSKHDLDPTTDGGAFWSTTYNDQMQWQMFVCGADRCLFVWETHDDAWPNPTPIGPPRAAWIERDEARIALLVDVADALLADIDAARVGSLPWDQGDLPADLVDPVHRLVTARVQEAAAKTVRENAWKEVQALVGELPEAEGQYESGEAKVSYSTKYVVSDDVYDLSSATDAQRRAHERRIAAMDRQAERVARAEAALQRATDAFEKARQSFEEKGERWHHVVEVPAGRKVTVTAKKSAVEK